MSDPIAVQEVITHYSQGCSTRDWPSVMSTFLPDGKWDVPSQGISLRGHDVLTAAMSGFVKDMAWFVQMNSPAIIAVAGDTATARSMIRECGQWADSGEGLEVIGFYDDELVRTPGGWKFARRVFTGVGMLGHAPTPPRLMGS